MHLMIKIERNENISRMTAKYKLYAEVDHKNLILILTRFSVARTNISCPDNHLSRDKKANNSDNVYEAIRDDNDNLILKLV